MSYPRLKIDLDKIHHNTSRLVSYLGEQGISVTGVTKSFLGAPQIVKAITRAGVTSLGDSRIENIEHMRKSGISAQMVLIRSPMLSQVTRVVDAADVSFNTELTILRALSCAAIKAGKTHQVLLMVELGDLREGILPKDIKDIIDEVKKLNNLRLIGLGANLACRSGVIPDNTNMNELSELANLLIPQKPFSEHIISGGNSSNLNWVFKGGDIGRVNNLRLGESLLLGIDPLHRKPIDGLFVDAFTLVAEVIESKLKPSKPWGKTAQSAFGDVPEFEDQGDINQAIVATGRQDIDVDGLEPPIGIDIIGASSDHLVLNTRTTKLTVGSQVVFKLNYSAVLSAMTSPHITKFFHESRAGKMASDPTHVVYDAA